MCIEEKFPRGEEEDELWEACYQNERQGGARGAILSCQRPVGNSLPLPWQSGSEYLMRKETLRDRRQEHRGLCCLPVIMSLTWRAPLHCHGTPLHTHTHTHIPYSLPLAPLSYIFPPLEKEESKTNRSLNNLDIPNEFMKIFLSSGNRGRARWDW